jgi:hypothetical protein
VILPPPSSQQLSESISRSGFRSYTLPPTPPISAVCINAQHPSVTRPQTLCHGLSYSHGNFSLTLHPSETAALLKTPSKTYSLRQKNTSNALILLSPHRGLLLSENDRSSTDDNDGEGGNGTSGAPHAGLTTIATVHETIELVPEADVAAGTAAVAAPKPRGKWHEKFGKGR